MGSRSTPRNTARVLEYLWEHPGRRPSDVAAELDIHPSTAQYHLRKLSRDGSVATEKVGRELHHYPTGAGWCQGSRAVHARLTDATRSAFWLALRQGATSRRAVVQAGHTRSATRWAISQLLDSGTVERIGWGVYRLRESREACVRAALLERPCAACNEGSRVEAHRRYATSNPSPRGRMDASSSG